MTATGERVRWDIVWSRETEDCDARETYGYDEDARRRAHATVRAYRSEYPDARVVRVTTRTVRQVWRRNGWRLLVSFDPDDRAWTWGVWNECDALFEPGDDEIETIEAAIAAAEAWAEAQPRGTR